VSDLTAKEQRNVRTALKFLHFRIGRWRPIAEALRVGEDSLLKVAAGAVVTASVAFRLARLVEVPLEELLDGTWLSPRMCPHCGHPPDDFTDEQTIVEDKPREAVLKLVK
jgi:hypothetical protein